MKEFLSFFPLHHLFEIQVVDRGVFLLLEQLDRGHALRVQGLPDSQVPVPFALLDTRIVIVTLLGELLHQAGALHDWQVLAALDVHGDVQHACGQPIRV